MARYRRMPVQEDTGGSDSSMYAPDEDALDHVVDVADMWPRWICRDCGTHHDGQYRACVYCGVVREDVDLCV